MLPRSSEKSAIKMSLVLMFALGSETIASERLVIKAPRNLRTICLSPSGRYVAGALSDPKHPIVVWETVTGKIQTTIPDHDRPVQHMCFTASDKFLSATYVTDEGLGVKRSYVANGLEVETYNLEEASRSLGFSTPGNYLITTKGFPVNTTALVWDTKQHSVVAKRKNDRSTNVASAAIDRQERYIAVAGLNDDIVVTELGSEKPYRKLGNELGRKSSVTFLAFSPDAKMVYASFLDRTGQVWSVEKARPSGKRFDTDSVKACFTADGRFLITSGPTDEEGNVLQPQIHFRSVADQRIRLALNASVKDTKSIVKEICISDDGRTIVAMSAAYIHIWTTPELPRE